MTRIEKALSLQGVKVPAFFEHIPATGKPAAPIPSGLDAADTQRYQLWVANRENGQELGFERKNATVALQAAMIAFENYLSTAAYKAWAAVDTANREMQWRLMMVDVGEAVNSKVTVPPSQDQTGVGENPIDVSDVGQLGGDRPPVIPDYVSTGDPNSPELVFGDDGDIVTVQ